MIAEKAAQCPDHLAIETETFQLTYGQLHRAIEYRKNQWIALGAKTGMHVAFEARINLSTLLSFFALLRLGAVACPLSPRLPLEQRSVFATRCSAHLLPEPSQEIAFQEGDSFLNPLGRATLIMTSGSTAEPKAACHTLQNHLCSAKAAIPALRLTPASRYLLALPFSHVGGIAALFRIFLAGATAVFSSLPLAEALLHHRITHASLVPTQLYRLLENPAHTLDAIGSTTSCLLIGGAPLPTPLFEKARAHHLPLFLTYGMTEMSSIITLAPPESLQSAAHLGFPLIEKSVSMSKDQEICVQGPTLFEGYWDAASAQVIPPTSFPYPTRDLGQWTSEKQLIFLGRKDRLFISGGENIQPEEIERALCKLPGILAAKVVPIEDPEFGKRPCAYLLQAPLVDYTVATLKEALTPYLPSFKHPVTIQPLCVDLMKK